MLSWQRLRRESQALADGDGKPVPNGVPELGRKPQKAGGVNEAQTLRLSRQRMEGKRWKEKQCKKENPNFMFVCTLGTKQPLLDRTWTAKEIAKYLSLPLLP
jgi:hypothetical protein